MLILYIIDLRVLENIVICVFNYNYWVVVSDVFWKLDNVEFEYRGFVKIIINKIVFIIGEILVNFIVL